MQRSTWVTIGGASIFAVTALCVGLGLTSALDLSIVLAAPALQGSVGDALAVVVSRGFGAVGLTIATCALALWLVFRRRRPDAVMVVATMLSGFGCMVVLKLAFSRARPTVFPWIDHAGGFSFPSGHAFLNATFWLLFAVVVDRVWARILAVVMILFVGIFRVVAGVHWPSDVVAAWSLGLALVALAVLVRRWFTRRRASAINALS